MSESVERIKLLEAQKDLHLRLRLDTIKLCEILQFSDAAKNFVELLLEYVINNHLINRESIMLQAFQISLCWTAASLLKQKINHKESLANAKKILNFNCNKDQVDYVYAMLQCLKSRLLCYKDHSNANVPHFSQKVTSEIGGLSAQKDVTKSIKEIQKKFQKKMEKLNFKQQKEKSEVSESYKEEKENLEFKHKIESVVIRTCFWRYVFLSKIKREWENEQEKEVEDHKHQMEKHLENLRKLQLEAAINLKEKENIWVMQLKRWACDELLYGPSLDAPESAHSMTGQTERVMVLAKTAEHATDRPIACIGPITAATPSSPISAKCALDTITSEASWFTDVMRTNNSGSGMSCHDQENVVSVNSGAKDLIDLTGTSNNVEVLLDVTENVCFTAPLTKRIAASLPSFDEYFHNTNSLPISNAEVRLKVAETVKLGGSPRGPLLLNPTSLEQNLNGAAVSVPDRVPADELHGTITSSHDFHNGVSVILPSSEEQNPITSVANVQEKTSEPGVLDKESNDYASSVGEQRNLVHVISSSFEDQIPVSASGKQDLEAQLLAPNIATRVNQQNIIEFAVNQNSYQEMALGSSPLADQDQGTDMLATSSAAQDSVNQNTCQPMEDSDFNQVSLAMQFNASLPAYSEQIAVQPVRSFSLNQPAYILINGFDLLLPNTRPTFVTSNIPPPCNCELLQHELERLEREREGNLKSHEDKKLRLKSDMEKGIEDLKAQICQEYETKLQQIEAEFIVKKEDLLAIHKKIVIQMLLANAWDQAFKSNVTDVVGSSSSGVHHDRNFTVDRQLVLSCMQQNAEMPSLVSNLSPNNPPAACRQTTSLARVFCPYYGAPLIQSVDVLPTTVLSSTNPASQSHISSFSFSTGRPQGRVEISLPLQHQPCRPSIPFTGGTSAFSHEEGSSSHQPQRNSLLSYPRELFLTQPRMPMQRSVSMHHDREIAGEPSFSITGTSPVYQQIGVMSNQQPYRSYPPSLPHTQRTLVPTQQLVPDNIVNHRESAIVLPALRSASALELLMDTSSWHSTQNGSRLELSSGSTDVVCLSDED